MIGVDTSAKYLFFGLSNLSILKIWNKINKISFLYQIMFISLLISS